MRVGAQPGQGAGVSGVGGGGGSGRTTTRRRPALAADVVGGGCMVHEAARRRRRLWLGGGLVQDPPGALHLCGPQRILIPNLVFRIFNHKIIMIIMIKKCMTCTYAT